MTPSESGMVAYATPPTIAVAAAIEAMTAHLFMGILLPVRSRDAIPGAVASPGCRRTIQAMSLDADRDDGAPICPACGVTMVPADLSAEDATGDWVCLECEETGEPD